MTSPAGRTAARFADPWRTAARAQLRDEARSFALAALGLPLPAPGASLDRVEAEVAERLAACIRAAPWLRVRLTWLRVQHVALDGAPMEELVTALRAGFGVAHPPALARAPLAGGRARASSRRHAPDDPAGEVAVPGVADLGPVLAVRARLATAGVKLTLAALLGWLLTRHPALAGEVVAVPVDLPATDRWPRTTTVVAGDQAAAGVAGYAAAFGAELALARRRDNTLTHALRAAALLPLPLVGPVARLVPGSGRGVTGTLGVSVLKRSEVFVPAISDAYRAYLGVGDAGLPAAGGGTAAVVVLKCRRGELMLLARAVDDVLADPDRFSGASPA